MTTYISGTYGILVKVASCLDHFDASQGCCKHIKRKAKRHYTFDVEVAGP